jgi:AcrR family transcriptional regulator
MLEAALELFMDHGYEQTTIEMIAARVGMTKRTVYARHADKAALFLAAVRRAISRVMVPDQALDALETDDLQTTLIAVAKLRLGLLMTPEGLRLQRIVNTESYRFPEIFTEAFERGAGPVIEFVARQLRRQAIPGSVAHDRPETAAAAFMSMVVGGPLRIVVSGNYFSEEEIADRISFTVRLFLEGVKTE